MHIDAQQLHTRTHVLNSATCAATSVYVFLQAHMDTRKNVHATTTGRPRKEAPSAHETQTNN